MKKTCQKSFTYAIAFMFTVLSLASCGNAESNNSTSVNSSSNATQSAETNSEEKAERTEPVEISVMIWDRSNVPEGQGTVVDNMWTQWINEQLADQKLSVKYVPVTRSEEKTKIPAMMASGTAADIMFGYSVADIENYYKDGGLYDISPYIDDCVQLKEYLGEDVLNASRYDTGEMFGVFAKRTTVAAGDFYIRKDWLDTLNMEVPTTIDELYNVLKAFKEQDPGNVGKDRVIPMSYEGGSNHLDLCFFENPMTEEEFQTGYNLWCYSDPGYREYMRFMNKLYNEGLIDPEYFAHDAKEMVVSGVMGLWRSGVNVNVEVKSGSILQNLKKNIPEADLVAIAPFKNVNDNQVYNVLYQPTGGIIFIPKTAKDPEACMEYLEFLASDAGFTAFHGFEGEHYNMVDNVPIPIDADKNALEKDWINQDICLIGNPGYYTSEEQFIQSIAAQTPEYKDYVIQNYEMASTGNILHQTSYISPTQYEQNANITKVIDQYEVEAVTCRPEELDAIYDKWMEEMKKYDVEKILEERREYFTK
jgi:ABC-type glycerol-3-phosphate transport system substrate-binding protein